MRCVNRGRIEATHGSTRCSSISVNNVGQKQGNMAPHHEASQNRSSIGRLLLSIIYIIIGIIILMVLITLGVDVRCAADIDHWMPLYPGAELVRTDENGFFRPRASGITEQVYYTSDDPQTVRTWYRDYRREITRNVDTRNPNAAARGVADTSFRISEDPDSEGTLIYYYAECAYY